MALVAALAETYARSPPRPHLRKQQLDRDACPGTADMVTAGWRRADRTLACRGRLRAGILELGTISETQAHLAAELLGTPSSMHFPFRT